MSLKKWESFILQVERRGIPIRGKASVNTLVWESTVWSNVAKGKSEWDTKRMMRIRRYYGEEAREMD